MTRTFYFSKMCLESPKARETGLGGLMLHTALQVTAEALLVSGSSCLNQAVLHQH